MIVYQQPQRPFAIRAILLLLQPGMFILAGGIALLTYLGLQETTNLQYAIWFGVALLLAIFIGVTKSLIKSAITEIVTMEFVPNGFRIGQLRYNEVVETVIPLEELSIEIATHTHRSSKQTRISYSMEIYVKEAEKPAFTLGGGFELLGSTLEKIEQQKRIPLKEKELKFLGQYQRTKNSFIRPLSKVFSKVAIVGTIILVVVVAYDFYFGGQKLFGTVLSFSDQTNEEEGAPAEEVVVDWRTAPFFLDFPRKLYPVFENGEGLERQQLCGVEAYVLIEETEGKWFWRQHNLRDVWEAEITKVTFDYGDEVRFFLTPAIGEAKEFPFGKATEYTDVYRMKVSQQLYTDKPEMFKVYNHVDECK